MKNLFVCFVFLFSINFITYGQNNDFAYSTTNLNYDSDYLKTNIHRTLTETYAKLYWDASISSGKLIVAVQNTSTLETNKYPAVNGFFELRNLDPSTSYAWRLELSENGNLSETDWQAFTTAYQSPVKATKEISDLMQQWTKNMDAYANIEDYVMDQKQISEEDRLTFVMNFYKGVPPSQNPVRGGDNCNCDFVVFDNVDQGSPEVVSHDNSGDEWCGDWKRSNSFTERYGAAKEMQLHLDGRLKENQKKSYSIEKFVSYTGLTVQYCCEKEECCDADYVVGARYDHELYGEGNYSKKGEYNVMAADLTFVAEVKDGEAELMDDPLNNALEIAEGTTVNWEFWESMADVVVDGIDSYEEIMDLDSAETAEFLDLVIALVKEDPVDHTHNGGSNSITDILKISPTEKTISPNEVVNYIICSSSALGYSDAWGKKTFCNKGYIDTDGHVKSGYSLAISSLFKGEEKDTCCRNDYGKWVTGSYIAGSGNAQNMIAEAGLTIGCNGGNWMSNGINIQCPNSNPVLPGAIGIVTADNDCCKGGPVDPNFSVLTKCVKGEGMGSIKCIECAQIDISITIDDCPTDNIHNFTIRATNANGSEIIWWDNDVDWCNEVVTLDLAPGTSYYVSHTVIGECANETQEQYLFTTCKKSYPNGEHPGLNDNDSSEGRSINTPSINDFEIFPNPTNGNINFKANTEDAHLEIYDLRGSVIRTSKLQSGKTLSMDSSEIGSGTYIAKFRSQGNMISKKFIVLQ